MDRLSAQPASAAARITAGNGTWNTITATNEATAIVTSAGWNSARLPPRWTAEQPEPPTLSHPNLIEWAVTRLCSSVLTPGAG